MRDFLHTILYDYSVTEDSFFYGKPFNHWHFIYVLLIAGCVVGAAFLLKNKSESTKKRVLNILSLVVLGLYIFDLFVRPIAQLEGDFDQSIGGYLDKLPFHICTVMAPLCVMAQHSKWLAKFKEPLVILGIVGPLMYLTYPNGVFGNSHVLNYDVVQTILYHGALIAWGILNLTTGQTKISIRNWHKVLMMVGLQSAWALLGNMMFSDMSSLESWNETGHDWFFQKSGAVLTQGELWVAIIAPIGVAAAVFAVAMGVYGIYHLVSHIINKKSKNQAQNTEIKETVNV